MKAHGNVFRVLGMMQSGNSNEPQLRYLRPGAALGKGPHVRVESPPGEAFVAELRKVVDQLRDAATEGNWSLDWSKFNSYSRQAETATEQKNYAEAAATWDRYRTRYPSGSRVLQATYWAGRAVPRGRAASRSDAPRQPTAPDRRPHAVRRTWIRP